MRRLQTKEGKELLTEQEKVDGLVGDLFAWDPTRQPTTSGDIEEQRESEEPVQKGKLEMIKQVQRVLSRTSNSLAPGPVA